MCKTNKNCQYCVFGARSCKVACFMEMNLPLSFLDIQPHLIVSPIKEASNGRPYIAMLNIFCREALVSLEGLETLMARLKSCIAEGYIIQEAIKYAGECLNLDLNWAFVLIEKDNPKIIEDVVSLAYVEKVVYEQTHKFVFFNHPTMTKWME